MNMAWTVTLATAFLLLSHCVQSSNANVVHQLLEPVNGNQNQNKGAEKVGVQYVNNAHGFKVVNVQDKLNENGAKSALPLKNRAGTNQFLNDNKMQHANENDRLDNVADGEIKRDNTGVKNQGKSGIGSFRTVKPLNVDAMKDLKNSPDENKVVLSIDKKKSFDENKYDVKAKTGVLNAYEGQMKVVRKDGGQTYDGGGDIQKGVQFAQGNNNVDQNIENDSLKGLGKISKKTLGHNVNFDELLQKGKELQERETKSKLNDNAINDNRLDGDPPKVQFDDGANASNRQQVVIEKHNVGVQDKDDTVLRFNQENNQDGYQKSTQPPYKKSTPPPLYRKDNHLENSLQDNNDFQANNNVQDSNIQSNNVRDSNLEANNFQNNDLEANNNVQDNSLQANQDNNFQQNNFQDNNNNFQDNNNNFQHNNFQDQQNNPTESPRKRKSQRIPTAKPRPDPADKLNVEWNEEYRSYALKASVDSRFRIRHAPIPAKGSPWPLPQEYIPSETTFLVVPDHFAFHATGETCDILDFQFERVAKNMFLDDAPDAEVDFAERSYDDGRNSSHKEIRYLNVTVLKECAEYPNSYPSLEMDESYDLEVKKSGASIIAREVWGAIRGLETFSQLVYQDDEGSYWVNKTLINDFPRFPHRGILVDSARHFLDKETIITNLEVMAQNKMNVFHWHIVDEQSFPFESKVFPNLTRMGAYDMNHIYTHEDIAEIIEQARLRGIRTIPEFDTPGHTYSWGYGQDNLLTPCYDYNREPDGYYGPINPILKSTYRFLTGLFSEVLSVFKDKYVHLGGDEVPFDCWATNPFLTNFMKRHDLESVHDLLNLYERKLLDIIVDIGETRNAGSGYIVWQEVFDNGVKLKNDAIVQVWMGDAWDIDRVTSRGYRTLYSTCWYLDYISYGQDWDKYYLCDQIGPNLDDYRVRNQSLLIGGEACMWAEFVDDDQYIPRIWPRASAAAERLWSHKSVRDIQAAAPRIEEHRCRMKRRGIKVGVLGGPGHCDYQSKPKKPAGTSFNWNFNSFKQSMSVANPMGGVQKNNIAEPQIAGKKVYMVDMNAMYVVPLILVVFVCCLVLLSNAQKDNNKNKLVMILTYPVSGASTRKVRNLIYAFMSFAVVWCIWTAPVWLNVWENNPKRVMQ